MNNRVLIEYGITEADTEVELQIMEILSKTKVKYEMGHVSYTIGSARKNIGTVYAFNGDYVVKLGDIFYGMEQGRVEEIEKSFKKIQKTTTLKEVREGLLWCLHHNSLHSREEIKSFDMDFGAENNISFWNEDANEREQLHVSDGKVLVSLEQHLVSLGFEVDRYKTEY